MLFTVILEFDGVTSVSQLVGASVQEAFNKWFQGLADPSTYGLTKKQSDRISIAFNTNRKLNQDVSEALEIECSELVPLRGLTNVWCVVADEGKTAARTVLLNIVATVA